MCAALTTCTRSRREARASLAASSGTWRWVRCCCTPQLGLEMFESLQTSLLWTTFWRPVSIRSLAKWIIFCHVKRIKSRDFFEKIIKLKHIFLKLSAMKKKVVWKLWKHSHESAILRLAVCVSDIQKCMHITLYANLFPVPYWARTNRCSCILKKSSLKQQSTLLHKYL